MIAARTVFRLIVLAACGILLSSVSACAKHDPQTAQPSGESMSAPASGSAQTDSWAGRWTGVEGTYLEISGGNGSYEITIKDLDTARTFKGSAVGDHIEFQRDDARESLRATNGDETGMKWLAGKTNCLTIKAGEGYCRD
jgi:hypothetical protein